MKGIVTGVSINATNHGFDYFVIGGPGGRVYWFFFINMGGKKYGDDIPRFTKQDEDLIYQEHKNDKIVGAITFGDLYTNRIISTLTPLHEHVFDKWFFQRVITIGDSCHKVPISQSLVRS